MKVKQLLIDKNNNQRIISNRNDLKAENVMLVLAFAQRTLLEETLPYTNLRERYPNAEIVLCSSSGQISNDCNVENDIVVTAISFDKTTIKTSQTDILLDNNLDELGKKIKADLLSDDLKAILILSEGSFVNGTELINELIKQTNKSIPIFGGMAGDEYSFEKTVVGLNADATSGKIVAIGFYGNHIHFGFGSEGGWGDFGPEREVTKSEKNVLYKIDDRFALDLYKEYLGKYADELPGSSLYFPLSMKETPNLESVVRTILSIDEENKSMTFAGNIPEGSFVRLMKGNTDKLIDASSKAALKTGVKPSMDTQLALLVSCVGRRIVLGDRVEEELEVVKEIFGDETILCGFYSYGEFSPNLDNVSCELHNQTMTVTILSED
jgi:hypothetical protein